MIFISTEVQKQYEDALVNEEERISYQRKLLLLYQRQIRDRESQIIDESRNVAMRKSILAKEGELDNLLKNLERQVSETIINFLHIYFYFSSPYLTLFYI